MFGGSIVALVTPFDEQGRIDETGLAKLVNRQLDAGTDGFVVAGSTGEGGMLTLHEREQLFKFVLHQVAGKKPVIAGTGAMSTDQTIALTKQAMELGVDACLVMTPSIVKPSQEGLYQHFKRIAEAVHLPIILYNNPARTACDLLPETVGRLAEISNIVGIKEACYDLPRIQQLLKYCGTKMDIFGGEDAAALGVMRLGGKGVISTSGNVVPGLISQLSRAALKGDYAAAEQIDSKLYDVYKILFIQSNPVPSKWVLSEMGLIHPYVRLPLTPLEEKFHAPVKAVLTRVGCI